MRLLLDTHVAIHSVSAVRRLPAALLDHLLLNAGESYISSVALWEIAIKRSIPRRDPMPFDADTALRYFIEAGHQMLAVQPQHAVAVGTLPTLHGDPFDRLLVAQAISEDMQFVTMDRLLADYHPNVIAF